MLPRVSFIWFYRVSCVVISLFRDKKGGIVSFYFATTKRTNEMAQSAALGFDIEGFVSIYAICVDHRKASLTKFVGCEGHPNLHIYSIYHIIYCKLQWQHMSRLPTS